MNDARPVLVVGCGNPERGDDGAGIMAVRALEGRLPPGVVAIEAATDLTGVLHRWTEFRRVVFVDAVITDAPPGTVHRWSAPSIPNLDRKDATSTHGLSIPDVIRLAEALYGSRTEASIVGIEMLGAELGASLHPDVAAAIPAAAAAILAESRSGAAAAGW